MAKRVVPPAAAAQVWLERTRAAAAKFEAKVNTVTENPTEKAANARGRWEAALASQEVRDRWETNLRKWTLADWKAATARKGRDRLAALNEADRTKYEDFAKKFLPVLQATLNDLDTTNPRGSFEENMARLRAFLTDLHETKGAY